MARTSDWHLERINMESFFVGVGQETNKIVLLEALRVNLLIDKGAGGARVPVM